MHCRLAECRKIITLSSNGWYAIMDFGLRSTVYLNKPMGACVLFTIRGCYGQNSVKSRLKNTHVYGNRARVSLSCHWPQNRTHFVGMNIN